MPSAPATATAAAAGSTSLVWQPIGRRRASSFDRTRRWTLIALLGVLLVAGGMSVAGRIISWAHPARSAPTVTTPAVPDVVLAGVAAQTAKDYLTWNAANGNRPAALNNAGLGNRGDGWQGTGTLTATSAWVMGLTRINRTQAVVLVEVQATTGDPADTIQLKVAVPLDTTSSPPTPSAPPTLIGTLTSALAPQPEIASSDDAFGTSTGTVTSTLMQAYGSGQLGFTRAPGTTFSGLSGQVTSGRLTAWTPAQADPATPQTRSGLVTTTWTLPEGAGALSCRYWISIVQRDDRGLLQSVDPPLTD